jgi:hypothetical protein
MTRYVDDERVKAEDERLRLELSSLSEAQSNEVVLLEAPTEQALRTTHRRFFEDVSELLKTPQNPPLVVREGDDRPLK